MLEADVAVSAGLLFWHLDTEVYRDLDTFVDL
jgi:hypothetical protein